MAMPTAPMARGTLAAHKSAGASDKTAQAAAAEVGAIQVTLETVLVRLNNLDWKQNVIVGILTLLTTIVIAGFGLVLNLLFRVLANR